MTAIERLGMNFFQSFKILVINATEIKKKCFLNNRQDDESGAGKEADLLQVHLLRRGRHQLRGVSSGQLVSWCSCQHLAPDGG